MIIKPIIKINEPSALPRFAELNVQWIEALHVMEESDRLMAARPEIYMQNSNTLFSAHLGEVIVGACALKRHEDGSYELTKMAVDIDYRGRGIAQGLIEAVHDYAKNTLGLFKIFLLSNTKNAAALRLYARNGWVVNHEGPHEKYARCNIGMEKVL